MYNSPPSSGLPEMIGTGMTNDIYFSPTDYFPFLPVVFLSNEQGLVGLGKLDL
jgi:hypothetical protein